MYTAKPRATSASSSGSRSPSVASSLNTETPVRRFRRRSGARSSSSGWPTKLHDELGVEPQRSTPDAIEGEAVEPAALDQGDAALRKGGATGEIDLPPAEPLAERPEAGADSDEI